MLFIASLQLCSGHDPLRVLCIFLLWRDLQAFLSVSLVHCEWIVIHTTFCRKSLGRYWIGGKEYIDESFRQNSRCSLLRPSSGITVSSNKRVATSENGTSRPFPWSSISERYAARPLEETEADSRGDHKRRGRRRKWRRVLERER